MKKRFMITALVMALIASCFGGCGGAKEKLKLYIWGEYLGEDVISNFEKEYNCRVIVEYYDSNEMMYTKLAGGSAYDVLVPSDYMIERLINEKMLQPIDKSAIPNISLLADGVKNMGYDPDNTYSVPYFWGTCGIVYNKNNVDYSDLENEGFGIMKDPKYKGKLYMYNSSRDSFMIALKQLGYSCNTENENEINEAYKWLIELDEATEPVYVTDLVIDSMAQGEKDLAIMYSGDAAYVLGENENMSYYTPACGTNIWCDAMVIPTNAENPTLANKFINYMLTKEACMDNTLTVGYTSPNAEVLAEVTAEGGDYADNEAYLPRTYALDEIYHDNETIRRLTNDLWTKIVANE
jgi:spermidine/putrescine-binding protein